LHNQARIALAAVLPAWLEARGFRRGDHNRPVRSPGTSSAGVRKRRSIRRIRAPSPLPHRSRAGGKWSCPTAA